LEPSKTWLTFKCTPEEYAELTERDGVIQAPYFAKNQWVALETPHALRATEWEERLQRSYALVVEKLPKKLRASLHPDS
jgi:predicted DNA-binding protein (MmcQ/YjbR family)